MKINQTRVNKVTTHLDLIDEGTPIVVGLQDANRYQNELSQAGFEFPIEDGETVLPSSSLGSTSEFNAEGGEEVHDDQPKKTVYYTREWTRTEWHGPYRPEVTEYVEVPYKKYPRTPIPPPSVELTASEREDGTIYLVTPEIEYVPDNHEAIKHRINLLLEIFGECDVFDEDLKSISTTPTERVNWEILPPGEYPWDRIKPELEGIVEEVSEEKERVYRHRHEVIEEYEPDRHLVGQAGFSGYVLYIFEDEGLCICENMRYGNAIYVFGEDWEDLTKMSKAEILDEDSQEERIIHRKNWREHLAEVFSD